jgi:predicted pyridoxine 5'-phosphate oxidase superfamily flavin-nucleotide-binding protein
MGIIDSHEALRAVIGEAAELTQKKVIDRIDEHARTLIAHSPFVLLATSALAVVVEVEELYMHCAKAFLRSSLWKPETWPDRSALPSMGTVLRDQMALPVSAEELDARLDHRAMTEQY